MMTMFKGDFVFEKIAEYVRHQQMQRTSRVLARVDNHNSEGLGVSGILRNGNKTNRTPN